MINLVKTLLLVAVIYSSLLYINRQSIAVASSGLENSESAVSEQGAGESTNNDASTNFEGIRIVGISKRIDFSDLEKSKKQILQVWDQFDNDKKLQEYPKWRSNQVLVYGLYHEFSSDFGRATYTVGFKVNSNGTQSLPGDITGVPKGKAKMYPLNMNTGHIPNEAWDALYSGGVMLERYFLDSRGSTKAANALHIIPSR